MLTFLAELRKVYIFVKYKKNKDTMALKEAFLRKTKIIRLTQSVYGTKITTMNTM